MRPLTRSTRHRPVRRRWCRTRGRQRPRLLELHDDSCPLRRLDTKYMFARESVSNRWIAPGECGLLLVSIGYRWNQASVIPAQAPGLARHEIVWKRDSGAIRSMLATHGLTEKRDSDLITRSPSAAESSGCVFRPRGDWFRAADECSVQWAGCATAAVLCLCCRVRRTAVRVSQIHQARKGKT